MERGAPGRACVRRGSDAGKRLEMDRRGAPRVSAGKGAELLPDLLRREGKERRHQAAERLRDPEERRLRRAPLAAAGERGVEPVLDDVEVDGAHRHRAELVEGVEDAVELVRLVAAKDRAR